MCGSQATQCGILLERVQNYPIFLSLGTGWVSLTIAVHSGRFGVISKIRRGLVDWFHSNVKVRYFQSIQGLVSWLRLYRDYIMEDRADDGFQRCRVSIQSDQFFWERFQEVRNLCSCFMYSGKRFQFLPPRWVQPCCNFIGDEASLGSGVDEGKNWNAVQFCVDDEGQALWGQGQSSQVKSNSGLLPRTTVLGQVLALRQKKKLPSFMSCSFRSGFIFGSLSWVISSTSIASPAGAALGVKLAIFYTNERVKVRYNANESQCWAHACDAIFIIDSGSWYIFCHLHSRTNNEFSMIRPRRFRNLLTMTNSSKNLKHPAGYKEVWHQKCQIKYHLACVF